MVAKVIDTNVAVVANGRDVNASPDCQVNAIDALLAMRENQVVIDSDGHALHEYSKRLRGEGQPGVGDLFYRHVLDNQGNAERVRQAQLNGVRAQPLTDAFQNGALRAFDPSDRVFALCAVVGRARVAVCTDSDWTEHEVGLSACGVHIEFVCGRRAAQKT